MILGISKTESIRMCLRKEKGMRRYVILMVLLGFLYNMAWSSGENESSASDVETIDLYYWDENQKSAIDKIISGFEEENPQIKVIGTIVPWSQYWTKLQTTLTAGAGPDVFWLNAANAVQFIPAGLIYNIQELINEDRIDMSVMPDVSKELYTYNGDLYGIPKDYDNVGLFYNKALFDKAGLSYPDSTWTWQDYRNAAIELTIPGEQWGMWVSDFAYNAITTCFIYQNGGQIYNEAGTASAVNSPEAYEAVQFLYDCIYKYEAAPGGIQRNELKEETVFSSGKLAMSIGGNWFVPPYFEALGEDLGVAPLPKEKRRATIVHSLAWVMPSKSDSVESSWKFLKYLASKEAGVAQTDVVIPAYRGSEKKWLEKYPTLDLQVFIDAMEYGTPYPISVKNGQSAEQAFLRELENIWFDVKDIQSALIDAETAMNEAINN
jgi:multiple sugar transport system substrate-binding protein